MAQNDFVVWAGGSNANVLTQTAYATLPSLQSGVVSGKASGQQANKTWRQSSIMAAMIAQFITDRTGANVVDDGTIATIENNFIAAITSLFVIPNTGVTPGTYGPTMSLTVQADGRVTALQNANLQGTGLTAGTYVAPTITVGLDGRIDSIVSQSYGLIGSPNTWAGVNTFNGGLTSSHLDNSGNGGQFRLTQGNFGVILRNDGSSMYLLSTPSGQQNGIWNNFRPFAWNLTTGGVNIDGSGVGTFFGGAIVLPNQTGAGGQAPGFIEGHDTGGTQRIMHMYDSANFNCAMTGLSGYVVRRYTDSAQMFAVDNSGNITITGNTFFGTGGQFYADPNSAGTQLINFAPNQYLQFIPGNGFVLQTTGTVTVNAPGTLSVQGPIGATGAIGAGGNITSNGGRLRAAVGAFGSGDVGAATLLGDFILNATGNDVPAFIRVPNGFIIQSGHGQTVTGADFVTFPNAFPNACINVLAHEGAPGGWNVGGILSPTVFGTQQLSNVNFALFCIRANLSGGTGWNFATGITYRYIAIGY